MQKLLGYIWGNRLFPQKALKTTAGYRLEIISCGEKSQVGHFSNAIIKIEGKELHGNVVLHCNSSDWEEEIVKKESHHDNAILHVTLNDNIETIGKNGEAIQQLRLNCPESLHDAYTNMQKQSFTLPCMHIAAECGNAELRSFLSGLLAERLEEKSARISTLLDNCDKRWNDALFKLLARYFGFGIQSNIFEEWAALLNMQALAKHRDNIEQIEAMFFGQAGLLNEESIPQYYRADAAGSEYYNTLLREYKFLKGKFGLQEMNHGKWNGNATPHIRIARMAALLQRGSVSIDRIAACNTIAELRKLFQTQPSTYWQHHTQFGSTLTVGTGDIKEKQLDVLIINTVIPMLHCYGKHRHNTEACNKAEDYLYVINSEDNSIIRRWTQQGVCIGCAAESQALIQLNNAFCTKHRCPECLFAHIYFRRNISL